MIADVVNVRFDSEVQLMDVVTRYAAECTARVVQIAAALNQPPQVK